ncbi:MAG: DnaJ domain-containing protein, partial [Desulfobacterales bacterium]|nr:DnaJ domain-containing protein [Desulfobacterales bacterium]
YHRQARQTHPDTQNGDRNQFLAVHEAYAVLVNPDRRRQYDDSRTHAMHLGWSEDARPDHQGEPAQADSLAGRMRSALLLIAVTVAFLVAVAVVVDMIIRG